MYSNGSIAPVAAESMASTPCWIDSPAALVATATDAPYDAAAVARRQVRSAILAGGDITAASAGIVFEAIQGAPFVGFDPASMAAATTRGIVAGAIDAAAVLGAESTLFAAAATRGAVLGSAHVTTSDGEAITIMDLITVAAIRGAMVGAEDAGIDTVQLEHAIVREMQE